MDAGVRRAGPGDITALIELEDEARAAANLLRGGARLLADHPPISAAWDDWLVDGRRAVWIALIDAVPVGYLALELAAEAGGVGRIVQVFVTPGGRELGLGEELVEAAIQALVADGASAVDAVALPGDRLTKNLFERAGLVARMIVVSRPLGG